MVRRLQISQLILLCRGWFCGRHDGARDSLPIATARVQSISQLTASVLRLATSWTQAHLDHLYSFTDSCYAPTQAEFSRNWGRLVRMPPASNLPMS